jgi:MOSC domain-containing protein YiiM
MFLMLPNEARAQVSTTKRTQATMVTTVTGSILQINISRGGVPKRSIPEGEVNSLGIIGDEHAHPEFHGGPRQALLLITAEGIDELIAQGFPLFYGALGENITTRGLDRRWMRSGQRYRIGEIMIELTKLRQPCDQLSVYGPGIQRAVYDAPVRAGDIASPRWALGGFYASVMQTGTIRTGDPIELLEELA